MSQSCIVRVQFSVGCVVCTKCAVVSVLYFNESWPKIMADTVTHFRLHPKLSDLGLFQIKVFENTYFK